MGNQVTADQLIALINRRKASARERGTHLSLEGRAVYRELSYLLGRCTAHKHDIRTIEPQGD